MISQEHVFAPETSVSAACLLLHPAVVQLWEAFRLAQHVSSADDPKNAVDFALSIRDLHELGMSEWQMRWLTLSGYAQYVSVHSSGRVAAEEADRLQFCEDGLLPLTADGSDLFREITDAVSAAVADHDRVCSDLNDGKAALIPHWNAKLRELRVGQFVVKQLKNRAKNQELVLSVFQEENWPPRIDDPLPQQRGVVTRPRLRLRDTITNLNRNHLQTHCLRFRGDGTGQGVRWELLE